MFIIIFLFIKKTEFHGFRDLNKATTVAGESLTSESAVADYISGMLLLESEPEFNIKNAGTYKSNGETFYEFRCYR